LVPDDARSLSLRATWNFINGTGLPWLGHQFKGHKGHVKKAYIHQDRKAVFYSILFYTIHSITSQTIAAFIFWSNGKGIVVPLHTMEACEGSGGIAPLIINLGIGRCMVSLMPQPLYRQGCLGTGTALDLLKKKKTKIVFSCWDSNPG
jgi:hypothetical protein